jgi:hypothetical protein
MHKFLERVPAGRCRAALLIVAAIQLATLAACGGGGYGGGGGNMPVTGVGPSKLFAADSGHMVIGSVANPNPAPGALTVDRLIGPQPGAFPYNYAGLSTNIGSLALDAARDFLYVGNGTSILVFHGASQANGDIFVNRAITSSPAIGNTGSMFLDSVGDRLYVGDTNVGVRVYNNVSTANGSIASARLIAGGYGATFAIQGIAVDTANNVLYVSASTPSLASSWQILVFSNADTVDGSTAPSRSIIPMETTTNFPVGGIFLDTAHDRLYVASSQGGTFVMVFDNASGASGPTPRTKSIVFPTAVSSVVLDMVNDRLYAVSPGTGGAIYILGSASTASGVVSATAAQVPSNGSFTAVAVDP